MPKVGLQEEELTVRNLIHYPVTKSEIINELYELAKEHDLDEGVGDMKSLLLRQAAQYVAFGNPPTNEIGLVFLDFVPHGKPLENGEINGEDNSGREEELPIPSRASHYS